MQRAAAPDERSPYASIPQHIPYCANVERRTITVGLLRSPLRATYFGMSLPVRHMLFSVVGTDEKFKSQSFVDTVVQRGSDATGGWLFASLFRDQKFDLPAVAAIAASLGAAWIALSYALGGALERRKQGT